MAVEIRHSRTATLVDSPSNPDYDADELQADDWNAAHPITADGMGLLFANSAGDVAETMTVDMGTLTASAPLTFKQDWNNSGVTFEAVNIDIDTFETGSGGASNSKYFNIRIAEYEGFKDFFRVSRSGIESKGNLQLYTLDQYLDDVNPGVDISPSAASFTLRSGSNEASYTASGMNLDNGFGDTLQINSIGIFKSTGSSFTLPDETQIQFASWAGAPTTSDITSGYAKIGKDSGTGNVYLAANDGGTIEVVAGKYVANVGDGSATQYTLTHNFGTRDVTVEVFRNSGNYDTVIPDVERTSTNAVRLTFAVAPTTNEYRCVIRA